MYYLRKRDHNRLFTTIPSQLQGYIFAMFHYVLYITVRKHAELNLAEGL